jgi:hypothetical protein
MQIKEEIHKRKQTMGGLSQPRRADGRAAGGATLTAGE